MFPRVITLLIFITFIQTVNARDREVFYLKEWVKPENVETIRNEKVYTLVGYILFIKEKVHDTISKEYGGRFYLSSDLKGTQKTRLRAYSFKQVSKFKNKKIKLTGTLSDSKNKLAFTVETCKKL